MELNTDLLNSFNFSSIENTCRTCLKSVKRNCSKKCVYEQDIKSKIENLSTVNLYEENGIPSLICDICLEKLNNAVEFKRQVESVNDILKQYQNNLSLTENTLSETEQITPVKELTKQNRDKRKNDGLYIEENNDTNYEIENPIKATLTKDSQKNKKKRVVCPTCNKKLTSTTSLKTHLRIHGIIEKKLECNSCGKKYTNQYDLKVHLRKHSGIRPFSCKVCQKTFADRRCFEKHKKIHSGEKLFKCELCDKSFIHSYTLKTHQRVHSGEKPFICAKCGHSFTTTTQLKVHTRIHHTQEKPYTCNLCPKVFASSSGLSNHKMTHTGERKFICSICGKGSRTTSDLKCHLRTHTGERPFKCTFPDCDKKYKTNSQLCTHIRTHTGEKSKM